MHYRILGGGCTSAPLTSDIRQHIRPLRNNGDAGIGAVLREAVGNRFFDGRGVFNVALLQRGRGQTLGDDFDFAAFEDFDEFFELPLIHDEVVLAEDALDEDVEVGVVGQERLKFGRTEAFGETGGDDDRAALLDDGEGAGEALDGLIPGRVERIASGRSDDDIGQFGDGDADDVFDELDAFAPSVFHVAGADPSHLTFAVDTDVDDEVAAGHPGDACVFFVNGVAVDEAAVGFRVLEELRAVPNLDGLKGGDTGADHFAAAGVAGHQVRLDEAGGDFEIGLDITRVDPSGDTIRRRAKVGVLAEHFAVMVFDRVVVHDIRPHHFLHFGAFVGAVQPGGVEDQDSLTWDAGLFENMQNGGQNELVGNGTSDVANENARGFLAAGQFGKRRSADGIGEHLGDGIRGIEEGGGVADCEWTDDTIVGEFDIETRSAIVELDFHDELSECGFGCVEGNLNAKTRSRIGAMCHA